MIYAFNFDAALWSPGSDFAVVFVRAGRRACCSGTVKSFAS